MVRIVSEYGPITEDPGHVFNPLFNANHLIVKKDVVPYPIKEQSFLLRVGATLRTLYGTPGKLSWKGDDRQTTSGVLDYLTVIPTLYKALDHVVRSRSASTGAKTAAFIGKCVLAPFTFILAVTNFVIAAALTIALLPVIGLAHLGVRLGQSIKNWSDARKAQRSEIVEPSLHPEVPAENEQSCCGSLRKVLKLKTPEETRAELLSSSLVDVSAVYSAPTSASYQGSVGQQTPYGQPAQPPLRPTIDTYSLEAQRAYSQV